MHTIICIGAVYIDTILNVPHFPQEDEKLRANKLVSRRGGNTANTLEVLEQFVQIEDRLYLFSVLPDRDSSHVALVRASLKTTSLEPFSIYRQGIQQAASSYIIQNESCGTRTIVSYNELPEMQFEEFVDRVESFKRAVGPTWPGGWFHFEGRNPQTTLSCVEYLRSTQGLGDLKISVELEKSNRTGMTDVAALADTVFYSRSWAEGNDYNNPEEFLKDQLANTLPGATLICTWGEKGVTAVQKRSTDGAEHAWEVVEAWKPPEGTSVVEYEARLSVLKTTNAISTVGAGDTFIAGILFVCCYHNEWPLRRKLEFATELASRKVFQIGFKGLGNSMDERLN